MRRPRFIAEQARGARGPLGRLIAFIMARETWAQNRRAVDALEVAPTDHVLDVGCGPGRALSALAENATRGRVVGVDPSDVMVEVAVQRNRDLVRAGRVAVFTAAVERLPFADASFDKVVCVHVAYFWPDLDAALREIVRVLKPDALLVLLFRTDADVAAVRSFPSDVYRFRSFKDVVSAVERAGLRLERRETDTEPALLVASRVSGA